MVCKRDFGLKQEFEGKLSRVATNLERTFLRQMPQLFAFYDSFCTDSTPFAPMTFLASVSGSWLPRLVSAAAIPRDYCAFAART